MTKTEKKMKDLLMANCSECINEVWFAELVTGRITVRKEGKYQVVFRETGIEKHGDIFTENPGIFSEFFLQMLSARFDMLLRVCGSMLARQLTDFDEVVIDIRYGVGVKDDAPVTCNLVNTSGCPQPLFDDLYEIMTDNLELITDTFLRELRRFAESTEEKLN